MIHCSRELVNAMATGYAPAGSSATEMATDLWPACNASRYAEHTAWASAGWAKSGQAIEHERCADGAGRPPAIVDCPACLALMRAAICPVRWDALCERGLVDFLVPKSEAA